MEKLRFGINRIKNLKTSNVKSAITHKSSNAIVLGYILAAGVGELILVDPTITVTSHLNTLKISLKKKCQENEHFQDV